MASVPLIFAEEGVENGGKDEVFGDIRDNFSRNDNVSNANIQIRMAFVRKVYGLLSMQLLITAIVAVIFMTCEPLKLFVRENYSEWMLWVSLVPLIGTLIPLHIFRRVHPANLILLCAFTLSMSYVVGVAVSMIDKSIVLEALFITLAVVIALTAYTYTKQKKISHS